MSSVGDPDPEELLGLASQGDNLALGRLLELYRQYLRLLARVQVRREVQGKIDASDLVQETFLEAHRNFAQFRGRREGELVAWLRQILASRLANAMRRYCGTQRRNVRLEQAIAQGLEQSSQVMEQAIVAPDSSPNERVARREQSVLLADAMGQLPEDYREVIALRHLEGLPFPEVARAMGRSQDSVKKLWTRGLGELRRLME